MTFYNVHIMATKNDNGFCVTFTNLDQAKECARHARDVDGCYHVRITKS